MDSLIAEGRALPAYAALPATAASLVMILIVLRGTNGRATRFVMFAIWLRFILSAFHPITFEQSPLGPSWNALGSLFVCGMGLLMLRPRPLFDVGLVPFYLLFLVILLSGIVNHRAPDTLDMMIKYVYLMVLALTTADAFEENGWEYTLGRLFVPFLVPFGFQALSVLLGVSKVTELDNSISYIGGFKHEAGFSVSLAGGLLLVCLRRHMKVGLKIGLVGLCFAGIVLANYRTAIVALAPLIGAAVLIGASRLVLPRQRILVVGLISIMVLMVAGVFATTNAERFADIGTVITRNTDLIQQPDQYPEADRHIMSGRPLIWSQYLYGYANGTSIQKLFGLGPNAWEGQFNVYAHNTLLSSLYELGVAGMFATAFLWAWMLALSCARTELRPSLIAAHVSFFILNMATMPMWMIEGMIFYGLLCGASIHAWRSSRGVSAASPAPPPLRFRPRARPGLAASSGTPL
ncbi:O-antigen ligase family protein [Sphingomonas montana]|uniref:O-antigen ligase family protein n=1 Tax=Sphingomonas montana TaxID=1843236 RepID=UPI00096CCAAE|nr:O-antigen ligase family protein [Sphingomonas montana]